MLIRKKILLKLHLDKYSYKMLKSDIEILGTAYLTYTIFTLEGAHLIIEDAF